MLLVTERGRIDLDDLEIGIIGRDGMTGASVILGDEKRVPHETYIQIAGSGQRLSADHLREAIEAKWELIEIIVGLCPQVHDADHGHTALANGRHKIEERLARWLLMV